MISSMTAFARHSEQHDWGVITWELRTVNHRYFELELRLPESLRELEMPLRALAAAQLRRGKIEGHLKYKPTPGAGVLSVNRPLAQQLAQASEALRAIWGHECAASLTDLLAWPGLLQSTESDNSDVHRSALAVFERTLQAVVTVRQREGQALRQRLEERLVQVLHEVAYIQQRLPIVLAKQRQKIYARIEEFKLTIEPQRLEEELLLLMQKMDVAEEIERLQIHVDEVRQALQSNEPIGRRLDFLMQELHREANTLGAKSADAEVTHAAIRLKVVIEQMREQVQNVE